MRFHQFQETWHEKLQHLIQQLKKAPSPPATTEENNQLHHLVEKSLSHVMDYYLVKSAAVQNDVLNVLAAPWATAFERSLHWIAGWRPTTAFQLIHTRSTMFIESRVYNMLNGGLAFMTGDLGDLSADRFTSLSRLQCRTVQEENALSDQLSAWQNGVGELLLMKYEEEEFEEKMRDLAVIVQKADELRVKTLREVVQLLTPQQASEFFISASHLYFTVRDFGLNHDRQHHAS
nr:PREDICTED: transcription factor TGA2-like [Daucus carota subsp. sativus]